MKQASVLVVGGSGGLGAAICRALAPDWGRVAVGYRSGLDAAQAVAQVMGDQPEADTATLIRAALKLLAPKA